MINVMQPTLGQEELDAIKNVFESNWIGKGRLVADFEKMYAEHLGSTPNRVLSTSVLSAQGMPCVRMVPDLSFAMLIRGH